MTEFKKTFAGKSPATEIALRATRAGPPRATLQIDHIWPGRNYRSLGLISMRHSHNVKRTMPFSCQLKLPPHNGSPIEAKLETWEKESFGMLEKGDVIANVMIDGVPHALCVNFPCGFISKAAQVGDMIKTGDLVAGCGADGESIPYGRDYLFIRTV